MTHPFFAAVQAAYDAHGLPDDIYMLSISHGANGFTVWTDRKLLTSGNGDTLAGAHRAAHANHAAKVSELAAARAALEAAGLDPKLIAA